MWQAMAKRGGKSDLPQVEEEEVEIKVRAGERSEIQEFLRTLRSGRGGHSGNVGAVIRAQQQPPMWNGQAGLFESWYKKYLAWVRLHGLNGQQVLQALNGAVTDIASSALQVWYAEAGDTQVEDARVGETIRAIFAPLLNAKGDRERWLGLRQLADEAPRVYAIRLKEAVVCAKAAGASIVRTRVWNKSGTSLEPYRIPNKQHGWLRGSFHRHICVRALSVFPVFSLRSSHVIQQVLRGSTARREPGHMVETAVPERLCLGRSGMASLWRAPVCPCSPDLLHSRFPQMCAPRLRAECCRIQPPPPVVLLQARGAIRPRSAERALKPQISARVRQVVDDRSPPRDGPSRGSR